MPASSCKFGNTRARAGESQLENINLWQNFFCFTLQNRYRKSAARRMMGENENLLGDSMSEMTKICEEFISLNRFLISQTYLKTDFSKLIVQDQFLKTALTTAFSKSITQNRFPNSVLGMLKPTSSSLSLIGLKPTYLSLSSPYILILLNVGVTSNPLRVYDYSSFPYVFSLQPGIRARNILGFLRRRRHWHLLQCRRHLLQHCRHRFLAYASSSSRLRRHHDVIASSSRLRAIVFIFYFFRLRFVLRLRRRVASAVNLLRSSAVRLRPLLRRRHRLSAAYHRGRRLFAKRLCIAAVASSRRVDGSSSQIVGGSSSTSVASSSSACGLPIRPASALCPDLAGFALHGALPLWSTPCPSRLCVCCLRSIFLCGVLSSGVVTVVSAACAPSFSAVFCLAVLWPSCLLPALYCRLSRLSLLHVAGCHALPNHCSLPSRCPTVSPGCLRPAATADRYCRIDSYSAAGSSSQIFTWPSLPSCRRRLRSLSPLSRRGYPGNPESTLSWVLWRSRHTCSTGPIMGPGGALLWSFSMPMAFGII